jgi:type IX secretion system PorP/SprF family membrane protein
MLKLAIFAPFIIFFYEASSQNYPVYNGYFVNPFIYNPAAAATDQIQVNASYRRQWFGIPSAPSISSFSVSTLINDTRAGIGFKVSTFSRGILNSTDASLSYAYGVPLNKSSKLFFGLSGGLLSNTLNLNGIANSSDNALTTVSTGLVPSASFGILLKNDNGFNLGFALPKLFSSQDLNMKYSFSYFDNLIATASFSNWNPHPKAVKKGYKGKRKKNTSMPLELFSIYRYSSIGGLYEATGKYNFNSSIWISATYRQYAGIIPGLGLNMNNFSFSYFYEPGLGGSMPLKTHEILLRIQFGKDKKFRDKAVIAPASKVALNPPKPAKISAGKPVLAQKNVVDKKVEPKPVQPKKVEIITPEKPSVVVQQPNKVETVTPEKPPVIVQQPKKVETVSPDKPSVVVQQPKKDSVVTHKPRFNKQYQPMGQNEPVDTAAINQKHREERKELDKHIQDHADGSHDDKHNEPINERHDFVKRGTHHEELEIATYVIAGAFQSRANAEHYVKTLKSLGYKDADFGHLSVRNLWYVFVAEEVEIPNAKNKRAELQKSKIFKNVWLLTVQP